ncbi:hypothetical protein BH23PSE1_BH23PSE1_15170 [soil metagenome]
MRGRTLMIGLLGFAAVFAAALTYFQFFAFYERTTSPSEIAGLPVAGWEGIDAATSPLKLRACFETEPGAAGALSPAPDAAPLTAPFWFGCFDARDLTRDLAAGQAAAYALVRDEPDGFDLMLAVYGDGRAYLWRQLNARFRN